VIYGIGTDILKIDRLERVLARHGDRFAQRILGPAEMRLYLHRRSRSEKRGLAFLATRFAAKEAVSKALGLGMRMPMSWHAVQILKHPSGKPEVKANARLAAWMAERSLVAEVSLSDEHDYAVAFAVVQRIGHA
jgi:holo-[acyl-carrier protein] synthase